MARQPYLPQFAHIQFSFGAKCIEDRPEFAGILGQCSAVWSYVENEMGTLLGILLGAQSEAAIEVFLSLRRSLNQREALVAAAKHKLSGEDMLAFEALMVIYKSVEASRNDIIHGCYGTPQDMPDAILWIEMKRHVHFMTDVIAKEARKEEMADMFEKLKKEMFVYRLKDFEKIQQDINNLWSAAFYFVNYLRHRASMPQPAGLLYEMLCELPDIQREMSRLKATRENSSSTRK